MPTRHLGIDCLGDEELKILCDGNLCLQLLDISGSSVTDHWYVYAYFCTYQLQIIGVAVFHSF